MPESLRMNIQRHFRQYVKVSPHLIRIDRAKAGGKWQKILAGVLEEMGQA